MRLNGPGQPARPLARTLPRLLPRPAARRRAGVRLPLAAVLGVVLAAGVPLLLATDAGAAPWVADAPVANNRLTVTVDDGTGKVTTSTLDCGPGQDTSAGDTSTPDTSTGSTGPAASGGPLTLARPVTLARPLTLARSAVLTGPARAVAASCDRLERLGGPVGPVPAGQMCSMIYGGSQTAQVKGVWHGAAVNEKYNRANGCEVARWKEMAPVLPVAAGGA